ncbi:MAG: hypothetical protein LBQ09_02305, partial [Acidobacteriaceae bacterium]|nr:hypothetical protein [Acidobacteriaceae bacterium]
MVRLGALLLAAMSAGCAARERAALVAQPSALAQHAPEATAPPPPVKVPVQTIEQLDPQLNAALAALLAHPSAESYRHVAAQYARLRIFDVADKYLSTAIDADRHNASLYDARARVRRDAGLPAFGLGDAYRAWHFAPTAEAATTLGTLFEGLGQ